MKYRKKPVVIEAWQVARASSATGLPPSWLLSALAGDAVQANPTTGTLYIKTLEGTMTAAVGDWIIQGVKGELYPCKDEIFRMTYEPV